MSKFYKFFRMFIKRRKNFSKIKIFLKNLPKIKIKDNKVIITKQNEGESILDSVKKVFYMFGILLVIHSFLFEPFIIPSDSMEPNLLIGDFIFVSKYTYGYSKYSFPFNPPFKGRIFKKEPQRGDIIVFKLPKQDDVYYIKRLIGLPGDLIQMKKGRLYINNRMIPISERRRFFNNQMSLDIDKQNAYVETLPEGKQYSILDMRNNNIANNTDLYKVPKGCYFFMGDNRDASLDSRFAVVGFVPAENLIGKAEFVLISIKENPLKFWKWNKMLRIDRFFKRIS